MNNTGTSRGITATSSFDAPGTQPALVDGAKSSSLAPYPTDYTTWKLLAWTGPLNLLAFMLLWGLLARNSPPLPASATPDEVMAHYKTFQMQIMIGMSVCITLAALYMSWSVAIARVMERIEGPNGLLSRLETMGGALTCVPLMTACAAWLTAAHEVDYVDAGIMHMLHWWGWFLFDLTFLITILQVTAVSIVFMRDKREKKLVPRPVIWLGWLSVATSPPVCFIPFVTTGPLAFDGLLSYWVVFVILFMWIPSFSYYIIKAIDRLKAEDEAAAGGTLHG